MLCKSWRKTLPDSRDGFAHWLVIVGMAFCFFAFGQSESSTPRLDKTGFIAQGMNETLLHIDTPGRYSLQAKSEQGTELELVDKMAGPVASSRRAGEQDGRLDILLDKGTYKIRLKSHEKGKGALKLTVYPFQELQKVNQSGELPLLGLHQIESGSLEDLQQRSFWIYLEKRQILRLEAIGRNLKDCRLWRDNNWLVDANPSLSRYEAVSGQPMTYAEFHHDMNPGLYLLTCYGGEPLAWAKDSVEYPFFLRMGIPEHGKNGKQIVTISPFGRDTFLLPGETNFFQLVREDKKDTTLLVKAWRQMESRHGSTSSASIMKESRNPWCMIQGYSSRQKKWVTVQGRPGDRVVLEYFVRHREISTISPKHKTYWISSQHSAEGRDSIDATAILSYPERNTPVAYQILPLGKGTPLVRKINLLGENSVFLKVEDAGTYVIVEDGKSGGMGRYKIEPFMIRRPRDYRPPPFQLPGKDIELTKGFHTLTTLPDSKGILSFVLRKKEEDRFDSLIGDVSTVEQSVLWPKVNFDLFDSRGSYQYTLWLNKRHAVVSGLIVRPLPMDLSEPLPVTLKPGQAVPINIVVKKRSKLVIEKDKETTFLLKEDGRTLSSTSEASGRSGSSGSLLSTGRYVLSLKNTGKKITLFTLKTIPDEEPQTLKDINARLRKREKGFPVLTKPLQPSREQTPSPKEQSTSVLSMYADFARGEKKHFTLQVEEPGLYRLETSGRMAISLTVRTSIITSLFTASQNGIGRNALVQQYLKPGEYQITVQTQGKSKGRTGLQLRRTSLIEQKGPKVEGMKKQSLEPNVAVRYSFAINEADKYRLQTLGLGKKFAHRLEDEEGWPLLRPGGRGEIVRYFEPGVYHYYSLPEPVESRRITSLSKIIEKEELKGKGPHPLAFNETVRHLWREEPGRPADIFTTEITAPVEVTIRLVNEMEAVIHRSGKGDIGRIISGKTWEGELLFGSYEIQVKSIEENDLLPYILRMETQQLIPGLQQNVRLPATLEVSLGKEGLVDIYSFGATDVKASLWDEKGGKLFAQNDDMEDDWNFRISQRLKPNSYLLKLVAVGKAYGPVEVAMREREERSIPEQTFPFTIEENLEGEVLRVPFKTDKEDTPAWIKASSNGIPLIEKQTKGGLLGLALLREGRVLAEGKGEFYIPLKANTSYSLLLWRLGESVGKVKLEVTALQILCFLLKDSRQKTSHLEKVSLSPKEMALPTPATRPIAMKLTNANKVSYWLKGDAGSLLFSPALEQPFQTVKDVPIIMNNGQGWLVVKGPEAEKGIVIKPFSLESGNVEVVELGKSPLPFDFEQAADGPLLLEVESVGGTIGAMAYSHKKQVEGEFHWQGMWMEKSRTLVAAPGKGKYRGKIWQTSKAAQKERVRLRTHTFKTTEQVNFGKAVQHESTLQPGMATTIVFDNPPQTLELLLTKGLVAFIWHKDHTEAIVAALNENIQQRVSVSGGLLTILNRGQEESIFRIEKKGKSFEAIQTFDPILGFEHVFAEAGTLIFNISGVDTGKQLFVAGDKVKSRFLGSDGHISEGESYIMPDPEFLRVRLRQGILELSYGPGYVKVWQVEPENKNLAFMREIPSRAGSLPVSRVGSLPTVALENKAQLWKFTLEHPSYITADADAPGATALLTEGKILAISVGSNSKGRQLDYFLPAGNYQLWTRPLKGLRQKGEIRLHKVFPHPLDEEAEKTKTWLIRPGETQVFRFHVAVEGKVGVGVRTESDQLGAKLFDSKFNMLAESPLMLQELEPGDYLLTVETSDLTSPPIQYSPVVFGHKGSEQGIPEEVIRRYLTR